MRKRSGCDKKLGTDDEEEEEEPTKVR